MRRDVWWTPSKSSIMKTFKLLVLAAVTLATGILCSCHTVAGAGRDVQQAGQGMTDAAHSVQRGY
jgi:predicted small secreted protein